MPVDWDTPITLRGFSQHARSKAYAVRLSVAGKQHCIGYRHTQKESAELYDLALWKLAPKMDRRIQPNFPDEFQYITAVKVDAECPKLNELYESLPFQLPGDEALDEEDLRDRSFSARGKARMQGVTRYDATHEAVRRHRAGLALPLLKFEAQHEALLFERLRKVPAVNNLMQEAAAAARRYVELLTQLEAAMAANRAYYSGVSS